MEGIIGLGIVFFVSIIMIGIGIAQLKSKKPVRFYNITPPKTESVTDIKAWNQKHGIMWLLYGILLFVTYFIGIHLSELALSILFIVVCVGGALSMCLYHGYLCTKYLKR